MITFLLVVLTQPVFAQNLSGLCSLPGQQIKGVTPSEFIASKKVLDACRNQDGTHIAVVTHEPDTETKFKVQCIDAPISGTKSIDELAKGLKEQISKKNLVSVYNFTGKTAVVSSKKLNTYQEIARECEKKKARTISGTNKNRPCEDIGEQGFIAKTSTLGYFHFGQPAGGCADVIERAKVEQASINDQKNKPGDEATAQQPGDKKTGVGATTPGDES